jgi:anti-sigma factor RsiW
MGEPLDRQQVRRYLAAFADGELEVTENLAVLEQLSRDPYHTQRVVHQQQLKQAVGRAMREPAQAPASLRERIEAMAGDSTSELGGGSQVKATRGRWGGSWPRRIAPRTSRRRWWVSLAAAALIGLAAPVGIVIDGMGPGQEPGTIAQAGVMNTDTARQFSKRHVACAYGQAELMNAARYPTELGRLPAAMRQRLDRQPLSADRLDLGAVGYRFYRAGDCRIPGDEGVHVLYRARSDSGRRDAISLWIHPAQGGLPIEPNKVYDATGEDAVHPILLWKHDGLVYYLVGDSAKRVHAAADYLFAADAMR